MIVEQKWSTAEELKQMEKDIRKRLDSEVAQIRNDPYPGKEDLYTDIGGTKQHYIRGVEYHLSQDYEWISRYLNDKTHSLIIFFIYGFYLTNV